MTPSSASVELCGALHLHTTFSDGSTPFADLVAVSRELGLDYIWVTDHMTMRGREAGFEGFSERLLVIVGYEHEDSRGRNHYLVAGTQGVVAGREIPQEYIDNVAREGGIGFLAHPMERRHYFKRLPPYPWTDWSVTGFTGLEIWNQTSDWVENLRSLFHFVRIFFPRRFMSDSPTALLNRWDEYNRHRFVAGVGGVDAHARRINLGLFGVTIFPIKVELKGIRTHVFLDRELPRDDAVASQRMVLDALAKGHGFVSHFRRGDARGAKFLIRGKDGCVCGPGLHSVPTNAPSEIAVSLPLPGEIRLLRNGECTQSREGTAAQFPISQSGVYRIEVRRKGRAWIYSNPFPVGRYPL